MKKIPSTIVPSYAPHPATENAPGDRVPPHDSLKKSVAGSSAESKKNCSINHYRPALQLGLIRIFDDQPVISIGRGNTLNPHLIIRSNTDNPV